MLFLKYIAWKSLPSNHSFNSVADSGNLLRTTSGAVSDASSTIGTPSGRVIFLARISNNWMPSTRASSSISWSVVWPFQTFTDKVTANSKPWACWNSWSKSPLLKATTSKLALPCLTLNLRWAPFCPIVLAWVTVISCSHKTGFLLSIPKGANFSRLFMVSKLSSLSLSSSSRLSVFLALVSMSLS